MGSTTKPFRKACASGTCSQHKAWQSNIYDVLQGSCPDVVLVKKAMKGSDTTEELTSSNALKFRHPGGLGS